MAMAQNANFTVSTDGTRKKRGTTKQEMLRGDFQVYFRAPIIGADPAELGIGNTE